MWLNVMPQDEADLPLPKKFDDLVFPWLGPTRTSELAGAVVTDVRLINSRRTGECRGVFVLILIPRQSATAIFAASRTTRS
ncbi:hypothetical protein, partial [Pseudomonas protegens]|uniref:hypothetical protein n=1 Tax=Pseudomonas protegens TaxID=380021 RepID=UPI00228238B5